MSNMYREHAINTIKQLRKIIKFCRKYNITMTAYAVHALESSSFTYEYTLHGNLEVKLNGNIWCVVDKTKENDYNNLFCPRDFNIDVGDGEGSYNDHKIFLSSEEATFYLNKVKYFDVD